MNIMKRKLLTVRVMWPKSL